MKIGEVVRETGLSEKAIRLYVEQGLVKPEISQNLHRNSFEFTRENVRELERIAVFRKAGFSLFEISVIMEQPERLPELLESKRQSMDADIEVQGNVRSALERLEASQMGDPKQVADALRPAVANRKIEGERGHSFRRFIAAVAAVLLIFLLVYQGFTDIPVDKARGTLIAGMVIACSAVLLSIIPAVMAVRYGTCARRARKLPRKGVGTILKVAEEHGFDGSFARAGSNGAGTREPGIGGMWQIFFMLWGEIRPDCWFPVIQYRDEAGKERSNSFIYGGFRNSWQKGQRIEIAWDPKKPGYIYPLGGKWLTQKAVLYGAVTIVLLAVGLGMLIHIWPRMMEFMGPVVK